MAVEAGTQEEHVTGRVWTVRLDPYGRPSAGTVRLSCSRPACADQRLPNTAAGRKAAVGHVNTHLAHIRAGGGPRPGAWCGCRAADCAWHTPDPDTLPKRRTGARPSAGAVRCGGPVVLAVYADRAGRLWRIAETCARCAAATPDCRVLDTAPPPPRPTPAPAEAGQETTQKPGAERKPAGSTARGGAAAVFSDHSPSPVSPVADASSYAATGPAPVPRARATSPATTPGQAKRWGKIAQRTVPYDLQPDALRLELIELGDAFRAYQQRAEPDLALLAQLQERKARAFALWANATGNGSLRHEAKRAESAAQTTRDMHSNRVGRPVSDTMSEDEPVVERLLTRNQAAHARTVLDYVQAHAPHPDAEVRLAVLLLTLRAARTGTGNITGQDLTGWLPDDAEQVLERLIAAGWLRLPGTVTETLASQPEDPTAFTVPTLQPAQPHPFTFGKTTRSRISGWAQKAVGDRKIRKKKLGATTRLLALYTAAHTRPDGRLGHAEDGGLHLNKIAAFCALPPEKVAEHAALLVTADWLTEADTAQGMLHGQLAERALPLGGLL
ncbi:hypothetical protein [Streptomyces sp. NBC_00154]|uniref:hypothetical protein n=1 Tax=Streptomyces sp. NBC_00154 TaxID=2975670 RepID=UPI002259C4D4|nr:hypothetical protein [Streptomyces sp. NBC_00154]MCX5316029.1 hypothetical protein [Streptomyces sp. NBC_00154]